MGKFKRQKDKRESGYEKISFVVIIIFMLAISGRMPARADVPYTINFPDYYEKVGENEYVTERFLINDVPATVRATIIFEEITPNATGNAVADNIKKEYGDKFEKFVKEPVEYTVVDGNYRHNYTFCSFIFAEDGMQYGGIVCNFLLEDEVCNIVFIASNPMFVLSASAEQIVSTVRFKGWNVNPDYGQRGKEETPDSTENKEESVAKKTGHTIKRDEMEERLLLFFGVASMLGCFGIAAYLVGKSIYWKYDRGKWGKYAKPDREAEITCFSTQKVSYEKNDAKYKTMVSFTDGFHFITHKTNRQNKLLSYTISMDEELRNQIMEAAIATHAEAVSAYINKGALPIWKHLYSEKKDARQKKRKFEMPIKEVFRVKSKGIILVGKVTSGKIFPTDLVTISGRQYRLRGIEQPGSILEEARAGYEVGLLIESSPEAMTIVAGDVVKAE